MRFLRAFTARRVSPLPAPVTKALLVDGVSVEVTFKRHATASRFTLRGQRDGSGFVMTIPKRARLDDAEAFAEKSAGWIRTQLAKRQNRVMIADGSVINLHGVEYRIASTGKLRGLVVEDAANHILHVPGAPEHMARKLKDWLKAEAAHHLDIASCKYATAMDTKFSKLTVRDQKSRWGSCSSDGSLSYSWRLILAPPMVLDYVAAHEVAHLHEMNHGPRFWRLVLKHCPNTREAQKWLKLYGARLHRVM